ncbi:restriction endonuclease subunit S [Shewanella sp. HL-SH2]|uniref:restriction endonuclease subunit S n=1 Tax=Shewanella sp. HL-SH2 TaxID=3436238 RepID=UPI003EBC7341
MSELPKGWESTRLGDFIVVLNGYAFKSNDYVSPGIETVPIIRISDIQDGVVSTDTATHINKNLAPGGFRVESGDLLIAMSGATTGKVGIYQESETVYQNQRVGNIKLLSPSNGEPRYRNYLVEFIREDILKKAYGAAQPNISAKSLEEFIVPIAPLNEQIRIADKLDSILAKVDQAQARLEKIPHILKRFRQSVLAAATSGKLTREWREQKKLDISFRDYIFNDLLVELRNGLSAKPNDDTGTPILRISSVRSMAVNQDDIRYLEITESDFNKYKLEVGDLLFTRYNGSLDFVGVCGLIDRLSHTNLVYPDKLIRARVNNLAIPEYIEILFSSPQMRAQVTGCVKTTSGQKGISGKDLKEQELRLPSIDEQKAIVRVVRELFAKAIGFEKQYIAAQTRLDRLTQSVLAKAFRGELVPQDSNDEPASELLKRIKSSEVESKPKKKASPKRKAASTTEPKITKQVATKLSEQFEETFNVDLDAEKHEVTDSMRTRYQSEIKKAQDSLLDAKFSIEQFSSMTEFKGDYETLKSLIMNLLKGIPGISEPILEIESWDEKSGDYLMRLVDQK